MPSSRTRRRRLVLLAVTVAVLGVAAWLVLRPGDAEPQAPSAARGVEEGEGANLVGNPPPVAQARGPEPREGTRTVRGFVRDEHGAGLAGVCVELFDEWEAPWVSRRHAFETLPQAPLPIAVTKTQVDGSFAFEGARQAYHRVVARPAPPAYPVRAFIDTHVHAPGEPVVLVVESGVPLRLRVVDGEGRGRAAYVRALLHDLRVQDGRVLHRYRELDLGFTDGEGRLLTPAVPIGRLSLEVFAPGCAHRTGFPVVVPSESEVLLRLEDEDGAAVAGRVHDEAGRPIADAWVQVEVWGGLARGGYASRGVTTDAGGAFRIGGLPALRLESVAVEASGFVKRDDVAGDVPLASRQVLRLDVTLQRGCVLEGTVRAVDGTPVEGAVVTATSLPTTGHYRRYRPSYESEGVTDATGRYRLEGLPAIQGEVEAELEGWYAVGEDGNSGARTFSLPEAGAVRRVDLVLARGVDVRGRVVDEAGRGVPRVPVQVRGPHHPLLERPRLTDEEGRFVYTSLTPGRAWTFAAEDDEGFAEPVALTPEAGAGETRITLVWLEGAVIAGRVDYDGGITPFRGRVRCKPKDGRQRWFRHARPVAEDGAFRFTGAPPGAYELCVVDYNLKRNGEVVVVEVEEGQRVEDVVLHARRMGEIAGVVVDAEGRPAASARVGLRAEEVRGAWWSESTFGEGFFHFPCVPDVGYVLSVDRVEQPGVVHVGDLDLRLVLPPAETMVVEGTVLAPDGTPVGRATVTIVQHESRTSTHESSAAVLDGRFREAVERRTEHVDLAVARAQDALGRDLAVRPFMLKDVDPAAGPVEIRLQAGLVIEGRVEGLPAAALRGLWLEARREEREGEGPREAYRPFGVEVRSDATFRLTGLVSGTYRIRADEVERAGCTPEGDLLVEAGARDVVFRYVPATTLAGTVRDPDGVPVPGVRLGFWWQDETGRSDSRGGLSRPDGSYVIRALPVGVVGTLTAYPVLDLDRPLLSSTTTDVAAGASGVDVVLPRGVLVRGTVIPASGAAAPGYVVITATPEGGPSASRRSWYTQVEETDLRFVLGPLPPGRYLLEAHAGADFSFGAPVPVEAPADDVRLVVTPASR